MSERSASRRRRTRRRGGPAGRGRGPRLAAAAAYRHFHRSAPPPVELKTVTVTIPEGYDRAQTAAWRRKPACAALLKASRGHEGFLFPDTFELERHAPAADLVQLQLEDFKRRIKGVNMATPARKT